MDMTLDRITYFDVEYANSTNKSLCQLGMMCEIFETGEPVSEPQKIYINPEDGFHDLCIKIHGIREQDVIGAPSFPVVWESLKEYFSTSIVVGHNVAGADLDALNKNLKRYNLEMPVISYICTYELAKKYVPSFAVENYQLSTLCEALNVPLGKAHDALEDALASGRLLKALVELHDIDLNQHIKKYIPHECREFQAYINPSVLCKSISDIYGILGGISIDNEINQDEVSAIEKWKLEHQKYSSQQNISSIIDTMDRILENSVVTVHDIKTVQDEARKYLDTINTAEVTLARQILDGVLKGVTADGKVTDIECKNLREWLYDYSELANTYPFNKITEVLDKVLEDSVITEEETEYVKSVIGDILNPVEILSKQVNSVEGKNVCLSGDFKYGPIKDVEEYIISKGGTIDSKLKTTTNILLMGSLKSKRYSNGNYGTKFIKAQEFNAKGYEIQIVKESDFIFD